MFACLSLLDYLNNKGCSLEHEVDQGGLTLGQTSFPASFIPFDHEFLVDHIPFRFQKNALFDNMELTGQTVAFPMMKIRRVHLLGTAIETEMCDGMASCREGRKVGEDTVGFSFFAANQPAYRNRQALRAPYCHQPIGKYVHIQPVIWYHVIDFEETREIDALAFTDNPCMHVFCITLEKGR